jgi:hypothetical protein
VIRPIINLLKLTLGTDVMQLFVNHHRSAGRTIFIILAFLTMPALTGHAQNEANRWLRVFTEEESIIDIDRLSLALEQEQVIKAQFRTTFLRPKVVLGKSVIEFQARFDSIQFDVRKRRYRVTESKFLDASGKVVSSYASSAATDWKPLWGRTGNRLFNAASQLRPFGVWNVVSYRYASGEPASESDPVELKSLIGSQVLFKLDRVVAGKETCAAPRLEVRTVTDEEYARRIGSPLKAVGIHADKIDAVIINCEAEGASPSKTIMLRVADGKITMLWDGVFLELERARNIFLP